MYIPFMRDILQVGPVSLTQFLFLAALASTVLIVMEMFKAARGGRRPQTQMQPALR
jgi:hypothetical protein